MIRFIAVQALIPVALATIFIAGAHAAKDPVTGREYDVAAPMPYSAICNETIDPRREQEFMTAIIKADAAIEAGNRAAAEDAWHQAMDASSSRFAGDISARCLGEEALRRYLDIRTGMWRLGSTVDTDGLPGNFTKIYVVATDHGTQGVIALIESWPADQFFGAYRSVYRIAQYNSGDAGGWPRITQERALGKICQDALTPLRQYADREYAATLKTEAKAFKRPASQFEKDTADQIHEAAATTGAMFGFEASAVYLLESTVSKRQTHDSLELLNKARSLEFGLYDEEKKAPTSLRAEQRGDERLASGNNESLNLKLRDTLYAQAIRYFEWCRCDARATVANSAQENIQPALDAQEDQETQAIQQRADEIMKNIDTEAIKKSFEGMKKTDAEKKSFKNEADALEAELDF